jgi:RND family efflux transporter MFP subunit
MQTGVNMTLRLPVFVPILLLCLTMASCQKQAGEGGGPANAPGVAAEVPTVRTEKLQRQNLKQMIEQPAQIEAFFETSLIARIPGAVDKVHVDIGQRLRGPKLGRRGQIVEPGDLMAQLWVPELVQEHNDKKALVEQARAELAQAKANVEVADANVKAAKAWENEVGAGMDRVKAELDFRETQYNLMVKIAAEKAIDEQVRDLTKYQFQSAQASVKEVQAKIMSASAKWLESKAQLEKAMADVDAAESRLVVAVAKEARWAALVEYASIRAPYDCIVTKRNVDPGAYVQPGTGGASMPLFVVATYDEVRLFVDVPEKDALLIKDGLEVSIKVQTIKDRVFKGKVTRQSWSLDNKSRTLRVEIDLVNEDQLLRPGMYAYASFQVELHGRPVLPLAAVVIQGENAFCWQVLSSKVVKTPVLIGYRDSKFVEVFKKQALTPGGQPTWVDVLENDAFVVGDVSKLIDGQAVNVK